MQFVPVTSLIRSSETTKLVRLEQGWERGSSFGRRSQFSRTDGTVDLFFPALRRACCERRPPNSKSWPAHDRHCHGGPVPFFLFFRSASWLDGMVFWKPWDDGFENWLERKSPTGQPSTDAGAVAVWLSNRRPSLRGDEDDDGSPWPRDGSLVLRPPAHQGIKCCVCSGKAAPGFERVLLFPARLNQRPCSSSPASAAAILSSLSSTPPVGRKGSHSFSSSLAVRLLSSLPFSVNPPFFEDLASPSPLAEQRGPQPLTTTRRLCSVQYNITLPPWEHLSNCASQRLSLSFSLSVFSLTRLTRFHWHTYGPLYLPRTSRALFVSHRNKRTVAPWVGPFCRVRFESRLARQHWLSLRPNKRIAFSKDCRLPRHGACGVQYARRTAVLYFTPPFVLEILDSRRSLSLALFIALRFLRNKDW